MPSSPSLLEGRSSFTNRTTEVEGRGTRARRRTIMVVVEQTRAQRCARAAWILAGVNALFVISLVAIGWLLVTHSPRRDGPYAKMGGTGLPLLYAIYCGGAIYLFLVVLGASSALAGWSSAKSLGNQTYVRRNLLAFVLHVAPPVVFVLYQAVHLIGFSFQTGLDRWLT